jgi:hypothetical protein
MGKLLGTLLLSIVLIGSASAAFADEDMNTNQAPAPGLSGPFVIDNQPTPFAPNVSAQ